MTFCLLAALVLFLSQGCSLFRESPVTEPGEIACPQPEDPVSGIRSLARLAGRAEARARIQLITPQKKYPSISCRIVWDFTGDSARIRATGSAPFGMTLFDALILDEQFYLSIPSHDTVYVERIRDGNYGDEAQWVTGYASMLLDPWLMASGAHVQELECDGLERYGSDTASVICLGNSLNGGLSEASFSRSSLSPILLETPYFTARFSGIAGSDGGLSCLPYPGQITVRQKETLYRGHFTMKIAVRFVGRLSNRSSLHEFDPSPFTTRPRLPLRLLLNSLR